MFVANQQNFQHLKKNKIIESNGFFLWNSQKCPWAREESASSVVIQHLKNNWIFSLKFSKASLAGCFSVRWECQLCGNCGQQSRCPDCHTRLGEVEQPFLFKNWLGHEFKYQIAVNRVVAGIVTPYSEGLNKKQKITKITSSLSSDEPSHFHADWQKTSYPPTLQITPSTTYVWSVKCDGKSSWKVCAIKCNKVPQLQPVPVLLHNSCQSQEAHAETFRRKAFQM